MRSISSRQRSRILQLEEAARPLDPDAGERDRLMAEVHAYAQGFLDGLPERLAYQHDKSPREDRELASGATAVRVRSSSGSSTDR